MKYPKENELINLIEGKPKEFTQGYSNWLIEKTQDSFELRFTQGWGLELVERLGEKSNEIFNKHSMRDYFNPQIEHLTDLVNEALLLTYGDDYRASAPSLMNPDAANFYVCYLVTI